MIEGVQIHIKEKNSIFCGNDKGKMELLMLKDWIKLLGVPPKIDMLVSGEPCIIWKESVSEYIHIASFQEKSCWLD